MKKHILLTGAMALLATIKLYATNPEPDCDPPPKEGETEISPIKINTDSLMEIGKSLGTALEVASAGSFKYEAGKGIDLELKVKQKEICCTGEIKNVTSTSGSLGFDVGKVSGSGPVPTLYYPGIGFMWSLSVGFSAEGSIFGAYSTCDDEADKCGSISVKCEAGGKVTGLVVNPDVLSINGGFTMSANPTAKYCLDSGLEEPEFCLKINCTVSATLVWTTIPIYDGSIYDNCD